MKFSLARVKLLFAVLFTFVLSCFQNVQADDVEEAGTSNDLSSCRSCGLVNIKKEIRTSIVGGEIVQPPYKYPWMVVIQIKGENQCTGFIINEFYIMTAAHCATIEKPAIGDNETLEFLNPNEISVAFLTQTEEVEPGSPIQEIIPHPEFSVTRLRHDIVLLKLSNRLTCTQFRNPICLPSADLTVHKGEQFTISGWGSEESGGIELSKKLKEAKVENINMNEEVCIKSNAFIRQEDRKDHFYCVKGLKGETGCTGDSGGPMFSERSGKYYAVGVFAATTGDCATNSGSFYTSVSKHIPWIQDVMGSSFPGVTRGAEICTEPMGFENRQLPDSLISVSSSMNASTGPSRIRLNTHKEGNLTGGWIASYPQDHKPKMCIDFSEKRNLTGIFTQGLEDEDFWVVSYKVRYSLDNETWDDIREKKTGDLVFRGNVDRNTPVQSLFNGMITARFLEVIILDYHNLPALRVEILGCFIPYSKSTDTESLQIFSLRKNISIESRIMDEPTLISKEKNWTFPKHPDPAPETRTIQPRSARGYVSE